MIYRALVPLGITPLVADQLELWQIAELFDETSSKPLSDEEIERRIIQERIAARREGREPNIDHLMAAMAEDSVSSITSTTGLLQ